MLLIPAGCESEKSDTLPELSTSPVSNITSVSALGGGNVTWDGGATVSSKGICWSRNVHPSIEDNHTNDGTGPGIFISRITGLENGTYYYVRAYATNNNGTSYGKEFNFLTPLTDPDGNVYKVVMIGSQVWMAENLRTSKLSDNTVIPYITDNQIWMTTTEPGYCRNPNFESAMIRKYGALYNWYSVKTGRLCPAGWHVPDDGEWDLLGSYLGDEIIAGGMLKEQGLLHWMAPNLGATDTFGFTALPGGYRRGSSPGLFRAVGYVGWWWSESEYDTNWARCRTIFFDAGDLVSGSGLKRNGYSIRCVKD